MTGRRGWLKDGLGLTGQSEILGSDYLVRTNVRWFLENRETFLSMLKANGHPEEEINRIRTYNTTILEFKAKLPFKLYHGS